MRKSTIHRRADGQDPARGRQDAGRGGRQEARRQRADDLRAGASASADWMRRDVKRLRALEPENAKLKKLLAERELGHRGDEGDQRKKMVSAPARRQQVAYAQARGLSSRRACALLIGGAVDAELQLEAGEGRAGVARMRELSAQYPRYGYRRIRIFLGRDGHAMSCGSRPPAVANWRACRCRASGRGGASPASDRGRLPPTGPNQVWALRLRLRCLRQRPAAQVPDRSSTSGRASAWPSTSQGSIRSEPRHRGAQRA